MANDSERPDPIEPDLDELVGEWLTVPDVAERLGLPLAAVRTMLQEREVLGVRRGERRVVSIPARFFTASGPLPELPGTFTVLSDGGMHDEEVLRWLFTPDETLPAPGAPIDCLHAGFKTEIRRRAMETAF